jgi:hypothetical protein
MKQLVQLLITEVLLKSTLYPRKIDAEQDTEMQNAFMIHLLNDGV